MRSPSERLIQLLTSTGLCTRPELDSCEPIVRQLCHDLPDFDSVWLDALVQRGFLTPWQAERVVEDRVDQIQVGRFLCLQAIGRSTLLAKERRRGTTFVLRSLMSVNSLQYSATERLDEWIGSIDRSRSSAPACLVLPTETVSHRDNEAGRNQTTEQCGPAFAVSPYIRGWSMEELLIRGGRLPVPVVAEIGRELLTALAWLESVRLLHGDLVTRNVRLEPSGRVLLTSPFVRRFLQPQFALTDQITLRDCEGIAPEQVGTGRSADARSELYSLGCLLWQLLTSRPVVLTADPVSRLMKQKDQDIADVRGPVPDCPEWMSRIILSLTRRSPELRPNSAVEVLKLWRNQSGNSLSHCRVLARSMPDHSVHARSRPVVRSARRIGSWAWPTAATAALGTLVFLAARSGILPKTLRLGALAELTNSLTSSKNESASMEPHTASIATGPLPLPAADADGVIRLDSGKTYLAEPRQFPGALRIICEQSPTANVVISEDSRWQLRARSIELRGLSLAQKRSAESNTTKANSTGGRPASQLLEVQTASLTVSECVIQSPALPDRFEGIAWLGAAGSEGVVIIRNTVFAGGGYGLSFNHPPRRCEFDNVLFANRVSGILCEFQKGDADAWDFVARNVTQRFGFSVADTVVHDGGIDRVRIIMTSAECVYAPRMAILRLHVPASWKADAMKVQLSASENGNPTVVPPATQPVVYIDQRLGQPVSLSESQVTENSLLLADLEFDEGRRTNNGENANAPGSEWSGSELLDFEGPKLTPIMPGIDASRLPERK